jgi:hypothetical protein
MTPLRHISDFLATTIVENARGFLPYQPSILLKRAELGQSDVLIVSAEVSTADPASNNPDDLTPTERSRNNDLLSTLVTHSSAR